MRSTIHSTANLLALITVAALAIGGCSSAPDRFIDGVGHTVDHQKVTTARAQRIANFPCLRVNAETLDDLHRAMEAEDVEVARDTGIRFLDGARELANEVNSDEMDRLDDDAWDDIASRYFAYDKPADPDTRQAIRDEYAHRTDFQYRMLRHQVERAESVEQVRDVLGPLERGTRSSIKDGGRFLRAIPWAIFAAPSAVAVATIGSESHLVEDRVFETSLRLVPSESSTVDDALLRRYAPVIVQELAPDAVYEPDTDRIGTVVAESDDALRIDTERPAVYAYTRDVFVNGSYHKQLVYVWWFPRRPALKAIDPEAGDIEGATLRLTLDNNEEPTVLEIVFSCGCYHAMYPTRAVEDAAAAEYGPPLKDKRFSIERKVGGRFDGVVDEIVEAPDGPAVPELHSHAAEHRVSSVRLIPADRMKIAGEVDGHSMAVAPYTLRPYRDLERLTTPDGRIVSMFEANGLVRGAGRLEGALFAPIGMLSAGQPRQRGTQMTQFDQYDFDDPRLLDRLLRLPKDF